RILARIEQRQEEVVPRVEDREERYGGDGRLGQAEHDGREDPELAATVHAGGVQVLLGDREKELAEQEDRERVAEPVRDDQPPERPDEVQLGPHHVQRDDRDLGRQYEGDEDDQK